MDQPNRRWLGLPQLGMCGNGPSCGQPMPLADHLMRAISRASHDLKAVNIKTTEHPHSNDSGLKRPQMAYNMTIQKMLDAELCL